MFGLLGEVALTTPPNLCTSLTSQYELGLNLHHYRITFVSNKLRN